MHVIKKIVSNGLENLVSVSKTELTSMCDDLKFPFGSEISKDNLIENASDTMINNNNEIADETLSLIEMKEENEGLI